MGNGAWLIRRNHKSYLDFGFLEAGYVGELYSSTFLDQWVDQGEVSLSHALEGVHPTHVDPCILYSPETNSIVFVCGLMTI